MAAGLAGRMGADALGKAPVSAERVRAFFGLPIPEPHRQALEPYVARCATASPEFRWVAAANLHLTVRFLGHVHSTLAESLGDAVVSDGLHAFDLQLGAELGSFKRGRLARVIWIGLASGAEPAGVLAAQVEARCREAGLEPETRAFNPHLTLARAKGREGAPLPALAQPPELPQWRADELILYRSQLGRGGSVYEPLRRIRLR